MKRMSRRSAAAAVLSAALLIPLASSATAAPPSGEAAPSQASIAGTQAGAGDDLDFTDLASRYAGTHPRYRIPALTTLPNGDLLAVFDGRPTQMDLPSNIALLMRRSTDGGTTWQAQQVIREEPAPNGFGDPSLLVDRETGRIFVFYAASINQGFGGSATGNDPADPNVLHPDYSYSDDNGATWKHRRITSMIKDPSWAGMFAASGEGIQLRHGQYAGRLIQQYTVRKNGANYAFSAYSDDHGETWKAGELVGPGADENKTVELSDGRVMLNSRSAPHRNVAYSTDGGATYTRFAADKELVDPANNASIIRAFPDVPAADPRSRMLLFSNTEDSGIRRNLTVKMSCDDGDTWPVRKVVEQGAVGYSTLTALGDGTGDSALGGSYGLFFEREGYRHLTYTSFGLDWLEGACAPLRVSVPQETRAGHAADLEVVVTNQSTNTMKPGTLTLDPLEVWEASTAKVPAIPAGKSRTVSVSVTAPSDAGSHGHDVSLRYRTGATSSSVHASIPVTGNPSIASPKLAVLPVLDAIYTAGAAGLEDDQIAPWIRVTNNGNVPLTGIRVAGPDNAAVCNYSRLAPGASYVCKGVRHSITPADVAAGSWTASFSLQGTAPDGTTAQVGGSVEVDLGK